MLIVKSKVKDVVADNNIGGDVYDALSEMAKGLLNKAGQRAEANGRKTIKARDMFLGDMIEEPMIVVKSKLGVEGMNTGGDLPAALNTMLVWTVQQAAKRAEANGRKTIQAKDL